MTNRKIEMVDLKGQYSRVQQEIDEAVLQCIRSAAFINGPEVKSFSQSLAAYLQAKHVIPCANGTDALQIALMGLGLKPGDEVIVPAFTYVATAEVIGLLGLTPVLVDADPENYNIDVKEVAKAITAKTKAIVPVHLYGQCADMDALMELANSHGISVIEDTAQAIGAVYRLKDGTQKKTGTIGHIGCTSFFPSKNLGAYGDGGAIYTNDPHLAEKMAMIANHGQVVKYQHKYIGVNSRLDTIQAAILNVKLKYLDQYASARQQAADYYDSQLSDIDDIILPKRMEYSSHVFHQYTIRVKNDKRKALIELLASKGIPSMIYYPIPLNEQEAFRDICNVPGDLSVTRQLCKEVVSLPMHTELNMDQLQYITSAVKEFFTK